MSKNLRGSLMLLLTALIWGTAFVAQSAGMDYVGPFTFGAVRTLIGAVVLIPVTMIFWKKRTPTNPKPYSIKNSVLGGVACGLVYTAASNLQQYGISQTTAGKAGFITALYIVIVPLLGIFIGRKVPRILWFCIGAAVLGFYLLCMNERLTISRGDFLVLLCAFFFSLHIMVIDHFAAKNVNGVLMSCVQFFTAGLITLVPMLLFEHPTIEALWNARLTLFYTGAISCGVAYTLQIIAQKDTDPTIATLLMSLESVFAALSGALLLHEKMSVKEIVGCILVFTAVIFAQIPLPKLHRKGNR